LALKAMMVATKEGFDGVILVTDADGHQERIGQFEQAQESKKFQIPRALGLPVNEFDAWILADHHALSQVLRMTIAEQEAESLRHPKEACQKLLKQHGWKRSQAEFYEEVCRSADLQVVAVRCPLGFAPFLLRLRSLDEALRRAQA
jgi:hypothetical protein